MTETLISALPEASSLAGAIVRLVVDYPREWDSLIDEQALRRYTAGAFEFQLSRHPQVEARIRLPADQTVSSLSPLELLDQYWRANHADPEEITSLQKLARELLEEDQGDLA